MAGRQLTARPALLVALALAAAGCVRLQYRRDLLDRPPEPAGVATLVPGKSDLAEVLHRFGAPLDVWEGPDGDTVVAYGGLRRAEWSLTASFQVVEKGGASFQWTDASSAVRGIVMIFDRDLVLQVVEQGLLRDLRQRIRPRPAAPVDEGA